jgi:hypothetical protein
MIDNKRKQRYKIADMKMVKKISIKDAKYKLLNERSFTNCPFYVVTLYNKEKDNSNSLKKWIEMCENYGLSYKVYKTNGNVSKPKFFHDLLKKLKTPIRYIDINYTLKAIPKKFYIKNMDFMTVNLDSLYSISKCSDLRILKTLNDNIYCFNYNRFVLDFLKIWSEHNTEQIIKNNVQHKSLEYAFNISLSTNKLRCYWLNRKYILEDSVKREDLIKRVLNDYKKVPREYRELTVKIQQCGVKPPLNDDSDPVRAHYYGSRIGSVYHNKYGERFVEYF